MGLASEYSAHTFLFVLTYAEVGALSRHLEKMKKLALTLLTLAMLAAMPCAAQTKEQIKERKELKKASKSELNEKASKAARKEAKDLKKKGWNVAPGALPLEKQLDRSYMMQMEFDDDLFPKYLMGDGMSTGENYDGAKMQALELAKQNLAGQIQTEITTIIENSIANNQLSAEQAATVTKSVMASKNLISQSIGRTIPIVEAYRTLKNGNKEVLVRIAYNSEMAKAAAKKAIYDDLGNDAENLHQELNAILGGE